MLDLAVPRLPGLGLLGLLVAAPGAAQRPSVTFTGVVVNRVTDAPLPEAIVQLVATDLSATTDAAGRFAFTNLASGVYLVHVRVFGYLEAHWTIDVSRRDSFDFKFPMNPLAMELNPVTVTGLTADRQRLAEFEARRARGMGHFITREQIEASGAKSLSDLLRTTRGVQTVCGGVGCTIRMARAQQGCEPQFYIDGKAAPGYIGTNTPVLDIYGIEVFRGPSETPAEFLNSSSGCGVISIWTKSAPS